jgi:hypothetical protein
MVDRLLLSREYNSYHETSTLLLVILVERTTESRTSRLPNGCSSVRVWLIDYYSRGSITLYHIGHRSSFDLFELDDVRIYIEDFTRTCTPLMQKKLLFLPYHRLSLIAYGCCCSWLMLLDII